MNTRIGALVGSVIVLIILFLARVTGLYIHLFVATIFILMLAKHAMKKREHGARIHKNWKQVNATLWILLFGIMISGIAMAVESIYFYAYILHKLTSILFLVFILLHCKQHLLYWKKNKTKIK